MAGNEGPISTAGPNGRTRRIREALEALHSLKFELELELEIEALEGTRAEADILEAAYQAIGQAIEELGPVRRSCQSEGQRATW